MVTEQAPKYFTNRYPGRCATCAQAIVAGAGFTGKVDGRYVCYCRDHVPMQITGPVTRNMYNDGTVEMPYEPQNLDLVRALPGASFNRETKRWHFSLAAGDRTRVLEIADKLGLVVAPELREMQVTEQAAKAAISGLYPFQVEGVDWLSKRTKALLGDDMGLGKTVQTLAALPVNAPVLVVCPAAVKYNWQAEASKWAKQYSVKVCTGKNGFVFPQAGEIVVCNFDIIPDLDENTQTPIGLVLVVDEAHRVKNFRTARSKRIGILARKARTVIGLTGTPLLNRPGDLFGVLSSLNMVVETFGGWGKYCRLFNARKNRWGGMEWGMPQPLVPELLRRVMLRRTKTAVLPDLPAKTYTTLTVNDIPALAMREMDRLDAEYGGMLDVGELPPFDEFSSVRAMLAESRIPAVLDYVEDCEEQDVTLVVASAHKSPINALAERPGWEIITGDTPAEKRQQIVTRFQAGELKGVGLTIQAGGVGLTLTRAAKMLFVDKDWVPGNNEQCEDRICRIGQTANKVEIVSMISTHPLDIHIQMLLSEKVQTNFAAVEHEIQGVKPGEQPNKAETQGEFAARMSRMLEQQQAGKLQKANVLNQRMVARIADREMLPLTAERTETVQKAFAYMLSVCDGAETQDGQGFNKPDAVIAHWVLSYGLTRPTEIETAYAMLLRYRRQLKVNYPILFK